MLSSPQQQQQQQPHDCLGSASQSLDSQEGSTTSDKSSRSRSSLAPRDQVPEGTELGHVSSRSDVQQGTGGYNHFRKKNLADVGDRYTTVVGTSDTWSISEHIRKLRRSWVV